MERLTNVLRLFAPESDGLTESFVGVQAGVFDGSIVALLRVLLVLFVDPIGTVSVGQPIVR